MEGGVQELLTHSLAAAHHYRRAIFILELLASPHKPAAFVEHAEPAPSQQDQRVIQGYANVIQQRLAALALGTR